MRLGKAPEVMRVRTCRAARIWDVSEAEVRCMPVGSMESWRR